jgi:phosphoglycerol transferase MdoB-like AlkP superfamily enzyme
VFINIWDSYPVVPFVAGCALLSGAWLFAAAWLFGAMWSQPVPRRSRWLALGLTITLCLALAPTIRLKGARFSNERVISEMANNGALSFLSAALTRHLDFAAFYKTLPRAEAYARVRRLLAEPGSVFAEDGESIRRRVAGDPSRPRLNVVIILEESLGSEFWGCLGRPGRSLTPEMDRLATEEGLLFSNLYASGNRTVRGMEGVLSSFPPLPGDSIVKRDLTDNVETIARLLKRDGYQTIFLYGGRGLFDGMRSYAVRNGYDRFIEQKHFSNPTFSTIWGVCDEDLMARAITELRQLDQAGQPFLATLLTVSNHKPFTYPKGRIPEDPEKRHRYHAVKYADYALGQFFKAAKQERFWTNTVFAVVADHGARVYGSQSIPIKSHEIPLVLLGPAVVKAPARIPVLGGSLDVSPTLLGLIGRPYETLFFGRDLLKQASGAGRAPVQHNRDIGMFAQERLAVLGLKQGVEYYRGDPKQADLQPVATPEAADLELERDTTALFQVADELYVQRRYRIDP